MTARREGTASCFMGLFVLAVAGAALTAAAPGAAAEWRGEAAAAFDFRAQTASDHLARMSGTFSSVASDLSRVLTRLPPDARRHLVMGALLLFIWLMVRALGRQRAARQEKEARERRFRKYAGSPSYPGAAAGLGAGARGRREAQPPPAKLNARPGSIAARLAEQEAAAQAASGPAPEKAEAKRAVTDELDFSTLHKRAVDMPRIERIASGDGSDAPSGMLFDDPFDESELLDDDDPMLVLAGDSTAEVNPGEDDDPRFSGSGDETERAPEAEAAQPPPKRERTPAPAGPDAAAASAPPAVSRSAARTRIRIAALKRSDHALPAVARLLIGPGRDAPRAGAVLPRVLAKGPVRADVVQFTMDDDEVRDPTQVGRLAPLVRAAAPLSVQLQALVHAELAEADVTAVRNFGQALAAEGMALALEASVARSRLPMIVTMTRATHVAFSAEVVGGAMRSDDARAQLARVIDGVHKRGARVTLRLGDDDTQRALRGLGAEAPVWDYLEILQPGH